MYQILVTTIVEMTGFNSVAASVHHVVISFNIRTAAEMAVRLLRADPPVVAIDNGRCHRTVTPLYE